MTGICGLCTGTMRQTAAGTWEHVTYGPVPFADVPTAPARPIVAPAVPACACGGRTQTPGTVHAPGSCAAPMAQEHF